MKWNEWMNDKNYNWPPIWVSSTSCIASVLTRARWPCTVSPASDHRRFDSCNRLFSNKKASLCFRHYRFFHYCGWHFIEHRVGWTWQQNAAGIPAFDGLRDVGTSDAFALCRSLWLVTRENIAKAVGYYVSV